MTHRTEHDSEPQPLLLRADDCEQIAKAIGRIIGQRVAEQIERDRERAENPPDVEP